MVDHGHELEVTGTVGLSALPFLESLEQMILLFVVDIEFCLEPFFQFSDFEVSIPDNFVHLIDFVFELFLKLIGFADVVFNLSAKLLIPKTLDFLHRLELSELCGSLFEFIL